MVRVEIDFDGSHLVIKDGCHQKPLLFVIISIIVLKLEHNS